VIPDSPIIREALLLMQKHEKEPSHVQHVAHWSVFLFKKLHSLHELKERDLEYLVAGSLLHDTGWCTATTETPHHKESARLIREHSWKNLSRREREFVALIARYHRKSTPSPLHRRYQNLPKEQKEKLCVLAGILRVADAVDRSHRQSLKPAGLLLRSDACMLIAQGEGTKEAHIGLERKGDLFQQVFGRQPFLELTS
jgi:exopolyphosphatase/guanosine-5'-triphosphate,3'-diphosphate pyrophosphatase